MKGMKYVSAFVAALLAMLAPAFGPSDSAWAQSWPELGRPGQDPPVFAAGEILVKFQPGARGQEIAEAHRRNGGQVRATIPGIDIQVVQVPAGQEKARAAAYRQNPNVRFAELNGTYYAIGHGTTDPSVGRQWQYHNTGQTGGTVDADIDAFEAWHATGGNSAVAIAILDTGIDQSHEDLKAKLAKNVNFTSSGTVDDRYGHGTHVAGSAAASTNNGAGVAGTCPNCALYNVKVLGDDGGGQWDWIARGIVWSADNGAKVANLSLGAYAESLTVRDAVNYAWGKGVILTGAAGNDGQNWGFYPAAYEDVIAVAATTHTDAKASFSNYGGNWVDVAAPGENILSTAPDHRNTLWRRAVKYGTLNGTSMAAPHVAGLAGLIWSTALCGSADNTCVRTRIQDNADKIAGTGAGYYDYWIHGRINACRAVEMTGC